VAAAEEIAVEKPDLILLQETPSRKDLEKLTEKLFGKDGSFIVGPDASIIAKGKLKSIVEKLSNDFVAADWTDLQGRTFQVVSLRLNPPTMRIDLFNPQAWSDFSENRRGRRREVIEMAAYFRELGVKPDILGGDFNTPPDKNVQFPIVETLKDSFGEVGVGYGATCVNPYPCLVRIDQIWHSSKIKAVRSQVKKTENSDHRMLISDFVRD
jgi:endonuclease/exonuclease/phosphatase (EEP) superfamily protein YafD